MPRLKPTVTPFERSKICTNGISCGFTCIPSKRSCKAFLEGEALKTARNLKGLIFQFDPETKEVVKRQGDKIVAIKDKTDKEDKKDESNNS